MLSASGDSGVKLQYTHARLTSLLDKCQDLDTELDTESLGELLAEPIAVELVWVIARYDEVLAASFTSLEAVTMVKFLFEVANTTSRALKLLPVRLMIMMMIMMTMIMIRSGRLVTRTLPRRDTSSSPQLD